MNEASGERINNAFYDELGERWYTAKDDPVALLRAESRLRNRMILERLALQRGGKPCRVLDVGCGAGFLSNPLAEAGHEVVGVDLSTDSLETARRRDSTGRASYLQMDAHALDFEEDAFDAVCAMDFLEHTPDPRQVVREVARVLRPGGLFFFHTFNRNPVSGLVAIKGVEWFVRNTPRDMHVYELFIKPEELREWLRREGMGIEILVGMRPRVLTRAFWTMVATGYVPDEFEFVFTRSTSLAYCGVAVKAPRARHPEDARAPRWESVLFA